MILNNLTTDEDLLKKKLVYMKLYNLKTDFLVQALWIDEVLLWRG